MPAIGALRKCLLHASQQFGLGTVEFTLREPVAGYPLAFDQQGFEALLHAGLVYECTQLIDVHGPYETPLTGESEEDGCIGLLRELEEPCVEHLVVEPFDDKLTIRHDGRLVPQRLLVQQEDRRVGLFGVRQDCVECLVVARNIDQRPGTRVRLCRDPGEALADEFFDLIHVEISDGNDGHQIGPIPIVIEPPNHVRRGRFECLDSPNG